MTISKQGVANGDPFELIKLAFALNKEKLKEAFDKVKIKVETNEDLKLLSDFVKSKLDVSGKLKDGDKVIMFDTMRILDGMGDYSEQEKESVKQYLVD